MKKVLVALATVSLAFTAHAAPRTSNVGDFSVVKDDRGEYVVINQEGQQVAHVKGDGSGTFVSYNGQEFGINADGVYNPETGERYTQFDVVNGEIIRNGTPVNPAEKERPIVDKPADLPSQPADKDRPVIDKPADMPNIPTKPERPIRDTEIIDRVKDRIADVDSRIGSNTEAINDLRSDFEAQAAQTNQRFNEMDDRLDQVTASMHAITNARPFVMAGESSIGVGMGYTNGVEAIAVGYAHGINDNWSVSATLNHSSGTSNVSSDTSAGAGVQYKW